MGKYEVSSRTGETQIIRAPTRKEAIVEYKLQNPKTQKERVCCKRLMKK